ncbi:MAG TPA: SDR family oxidoreductase [Candidatus Xenobia bacterium]|nr:SDR family oxidoreductase [Candidatus Xenobia bacterium]
MKLENKVAIITGASEGIGKAIAERFAREGARVVLAARSEEKLRALAAKLGEQRALVEPTNVADPAQLERLVGQTVETFGGIDILVNNAGFGLYAPVHEMDWEHFREMWEVNFFSVIRLTRLALPHLRQRRGAVLNISSVAGKIPLPFMGAYCASKFALNTVSSAMRMELKQAGVRVVVVLPGRVATRFHLDAYRDGKDLPGVFQRRASEGVSAAKVADVALRALLRGSREVVVPVRLRIAMGLRALMPGVAELVLSRMVKTETADW